MKPYFNEMEKLAGSTTAAVRTEAMNFYKEVYKWMGDAVKTFTSNLKKAQIEELEKFMGEWQKVPMVPLRAPADFDAKGDSKKGSRISFKKILITHFLILI